MKKMFKGILSAALIAAFLTAMSVPVFATDPDVTSREAWRTLATGLTNGTKNLSVSNVVAAGSSTVSGASTAASFSTPGAVTANSGAIIGSTFTVGGSAVTYAADSTNRYELTGQGTNGQVVTFSTVFSSTPNIQLTYAESPGASTNVNVSLYTSSANPTNFTINGVPAKLIDWVARGKR